MLPGSSYLDEWGGGNPELWMGGNYDHKNLTENCK